MYLNFAKMGRMLVVLLMLVVILYGVFIYVLSPTSQQQTTGVLTSIFGVQLVWFLAWLRRSK